MFFLIRFLVSFAVLLAKFWGVFWGMLCEDVKCGKLVAGSCVVYGGAGMRMRDRLGYCPVVNLGPTRVVGVAGGKGRVGQQKQKKKK